MIYYLKLPIAFMNADAGHYSALGYGAVGALAIFLLFRTKRKEKAGFKIAFLAGTVFLLFPFFGHVLNGFGYAVNRWVWAYCFTVSLIVVEMFYEIVKLPRNHFVPDSFFPVPNRSRQIKACRRFCRADNLFVRSFRRYCAVSS